MADWSLVFRSPKERLRIEPIAKCVSEAIDGPVRTNEGELEGNPREGYYAIGSILGERSGVRVDVTTDMTASYAAETARAGDVDVTLRGGDFAAKLDMWQRLRTTLATIGYVDATLVAQPFRIVEDADAETAARLRAEIRQALVVELGRFDFMRLVDTRVDDVEARGDRFEARLRLGDRRSLAFGNPPHRERVTADDGLRLDKPVSARRVDLAVRGSVRIRVQRVDRFPDRHVERARAGRRIHAARDRASP